MDFRFSQFEVLTGAGALLLCLLFVCVFSEASDIEDELGAQTAEAVRKQNLFWASVEPQGQEILLTGAAPDYQAKRRAGEIALAIHGVSSVDNQIVIIGEAGTCQLEINSYLQEERVSFKTGRAELAPSSFPMLGMLASIARSCNVKIEVAGHTDSVGDAAVNLQLSQQRADAVRTYLVQSGVPPEQVEATGYGENQPIADNATVEGRKTNRRIEFRVVGGTA